MSGAMNTPDLGCATWRKSSYSEGNGGDCVEIALPADAWRKSSFSEGTGGDCVEVASQQGWAAIRDSKDPNGGAIVLDEHSWAALLSEVQSGELDLK
jgi:hypothetical protein